MSTKISTDTVKLSPRLFEDDSLMGPISGVFACYLVGCTDMESGAAEDLTAWLLENKYMNDAMLRHACSTMVWCYANLESRYSGVRPVDPEEMHAVCRVGLLHELPVEVLNKFNLSPAELWSIKLLRSNKLDWRAESNKLMKKGLVKSPDIACCAFLAHQQAELWDKAGSAIIT